MQPQDPNNPQPNQPTQPPATPYGTPSPQPTQPQQPLPTQPAAPQSFQHPSPPASAQPTNPYASYQHPTSNNKTKIIIIIVVAAIVVCGGLYFAVSSLGDRSKKSTSSGIEGLGGQQTILKTGKVGATLDMEGVAVTVGAIEKKTELDKYSKPVAGKVYMVTSVKIKNSSAAQIDYPIGYFSARTSKGEVVKARSAYPLEGPADGIAPNGETVGYILFEVASADTLQLVTFDYTVIPADYSKDTVQHKAEFSL